MTSRSLQKRKLARKIEPYIKIAYVRSNVLLIGNGMRYLRDSARLGLLLTSDSFLSNLPHSPSIHIHSQYNGKKNQNFEDFVQGAAPESFQRRRTKEGDWA